MSAELEDSSNWVSIDLNSLCQPLVVEKHFAQLLQYEEVLDEGEDRPHTFPDFGASCLNREVLQRLCLLLWRSLRKALYPLGRTPSVVLLSQQRTVWARVIHGVGEFYTQENLKTTMARLKEAEDTVSSDQKESLKQKHGSVEGRSANDILIEAGVRTGLSVIFSLLRQAWAQCAWQRQVEEQMKQSGAVFPLPPPSNLPNEVLRSALTIFRDLPSLSLSNPKGLSSLSVSCLSEGKEFLQSILSPESVVDGDGKRLATEILLRLAMQEGNLASLLSWVNFCLECLKNYQDEEKEERMTVRPSLSLECCQEVMEEIRKKGVSAKASPHKTICSFK